MPKPSMQAKRTGDNGGRIPFTPDSTGLNRNAVIISTLASEDSITDRLINLHHQSGTRDYCSKLEPIVTSPIARLFDKVKSLVCKLRDVVTVLCQQKGLAD